MGLPRRVPLPPVILGLNSPLTPLVGELPRELRISSWFYTLLPGVPTGPHVASLGGSLGACASPAGLGWLARSSGLLESRSGLDFGWLLRIPNGFGLILNGFGLISAGFGLAWAGVRLDFGLDFSLYLDSRMHAHA